MRTLYTASIINQLKNIRHIWHLRYVQPDVLPDLRANTFIIAMAFPEIKGLSEAQSSFNNACYLIEKQSEPTDDDKADVWRTAISLGEIIRDKVGDTLVYVCQEEVVGGNCNFPIINGTCYNKHRALR